MKRSRKHASRGEFFSEMSGDLDYRARTRAPSSFAGTVTGTNATGSVPGSTGSEPEYQRPEFEFRDRFQEFGDRRSGFRTLDLLLSACCRRRRHVGRREPRQHLVAHRQVIDRRRDDHRRLLHVVLDDAFVGVEVRVMRVRVVLDRVLLEADAGKAGVVERRAVGAADPRGSWTAPRRRRRGPGTGRGSRASCRRPRAGRRRSRRAAGPCPCRCSGTPPACSTPASAPRTSRSAPSRTRASRAALLPLRSRARRGSSGAAATPSVFRMRAASIMIAQPIALSVAPVAECHESRWPPSITTSSALSVPGISAIVL